MSQLPDKPSELIRLALSDLEKCEADPRYSIDMERWHKPNGTCAVCLAGAVMAQTCGVPVDNDVSPHSCMGGDTKKLMALDDFRVGFVDSAVGKLGHILPHNFQLDDQDEGYRDMPLYEDDQAAFKADMRKLADDLEQVGL